MTNKPDIADLYRRRFGLDGAPLDDHELRLLIENAIETEASLSARGPSWWLAASAMKAEIDSLMTIALARGMQL